MSRHSLVDRIDALLPQTQCTQCGYNGCRPYAEAIAHEDAAINRCPPGGEAGLAALATLLDQPLLPLDRTRGEPGPLRVAYIDEAHCIGCTLCIQACPVDAIIGANKRMHTVLTDWCTGCDLCVAPCPVDCIEMLPAQRAWTPQDAEASRTRHHRRNTRLQRLAADNLRLMAATLPTPPTPSHSPVNPAQDDDRKRAAIAAALARARARRHPSRP